MAIILYGLKNCDSCRAARTWFADQGQEIRFHDVRTDGLTAEDIGRWTAAVGWEKLVNKRSTTWRELPEGEKAGLGEAGSRKLLLAHPTLLKRPVIEGNGVVIVGFGATEKAQAAKLL